MICSKDTPCAKPRREDHAKLPPVKATHAVPAHGRSVGKTGCRSYHLTICKQILPKSPHKTNHTNTQSDRLSGKPCNTTSNESDLKKLFSIHLRKHSIVTQNWSIPIGCLKINEYKLRIEAIYYVIICSISFCGLVHQYERNVPSAINTIGWATTISLVR